MSGSPARRQLGGVTISPRPPHHHQAHPVAWGTEGPRGDPATTIQKSQGIWEGIRTFFLLSEVLNGKKDF